MKVRYRFQRAGVIRQQAQRVAVEDKKGGSSRCVQAKLLQLCPTLCDPKDCSLPGFSVPGILQETYWGGFPCPPTGDLPNQGITPESPALQADSLPAEPQGKPKNTGVGSLSLLQQIFLTEESNRGLLALQVDSLPTEVSGKPLI